MFRRCGKAKTEMMIEASVSEAVRNDSVTELENTLRQFEVDHLVLVCGLMHAAQVGSIRCLKALLHHGLDVNSGDVMFGETALMKASRQGNCEIVHYLITQGCDVNMQAESNKESALHVAARNAQIDSVKCLIEVPSLNLNIMDNQGRTPLMVAAICAEPVVIQTLISAGCDVSRFSYGGLAAIHHALNPRWQTARDVNACDNLVALLEAGVSVDMCDENGFTPVHYAINVNNVKAIKLLIERNCDIDWSAGNPPATPILAALKRLNVRATKIIHAAGCHLRGCRSLLSDETFTRQNAVVCRDWLESHLIRPTSLKILSRKTIRASMGSCPAKIVDQLHLPNLLKDYLLLSEIENL